MSAVIRMEVARKRALAAERQQAAARDRQAAERTQDLTDAFEAALNSRWSEFVSRVDQIIQAAKGDTGPIGPMPRHQWNSERTRVRFQQPRADGTVGWGQWSADLKGEVRAAILSGGGGLGIAEVVALIDQHAGSNDTQPADITLEYLEGTGLVTRKIVDGVESRYTYDDQLRPVYKATAAEGTALSDPAWEVIRSSFDAEGRPVRRQRLTDVPADDPDSLGWPA